MGPVVIILLSAVGTFQEISATELTPVVKTKYGPIRGEILKTVRKEITYSAFKGIPYAEPPIDFRRFRPPVDKEPWEEVLFTIEDGSNCVQIDTFYDTYTGSEDCLYLNVYTPLTTFEKKDRKVLKPVMVWIYGGRFENGYANSSMYGPDFIIEQDVILVSFNYRVGPLGFLNLHHENATGNAGLKDQNAALRWVKRNIKRFGGNPSSVTIFGQSAGGASVDYHVLSDMSAGLFHKSISMSGSPLVPWGFQNSKSALQNAFELGKMLGLKTKNKDQLLQKLYESSAEDMTKFAKEMTKISASFRPSIENSELAPGEEKFLTECPQTKYEEGRFNKAPHMMGVMKDESVAFGGTLLDILSELDDLKLDPAEAGVLKKWTDTFLETTVEASNKIFFFSGIDEKQRLMIDHNDNPIYYYQISVKPKFSLTKNIRNISMDGAAHGDDLLYLFHTNMFKVPIHGKNLLTLTRDRVLRLWTNFAKEGNPNLDDGVNNTSGVCWLESTENGTFLDIGKELIVKEKRPGGKDTSFLQLMKIGIASC